MSEAECKAAITLCMLTYNEEDRVSASLNAVRDRVSRVVVVDGESTDRTRELAEEAGAEVFERPWEGFVAARRHLLSLVETPWVMMIDADEVVEDDLWAELDGIGFPEVPANGFQLRRRTVFEGKVLKRAFQPDWKTTLVRTESAYFEDRAVHETLRVKGSVERLAAEILHYSYRSAEDQLQRIERYARLAAADLHAQGASAGPANLWLRPAWRWFVEYFIKGGFVDGRLGHTMAKRSAYDVHLRFRYLRDLKRDS